MVPEMSQCEIAGEWLVPNGGALVVSLGVHTVADAEGKAVVRERLAVIEAYRCGEGPEVRAVYEPSRLPSGQATRPIAFKGYINVAPKVTTSTITLPVPLPAARSSVLDTAFPVMPSRSLPEGRDADGQPVPLPPLPEITPMTTLPGTSTPCATPQGKPTEPYSRARPSGNSGDIRFYAPVATSVEEDAVCPADPTAAFPASVSKTFSFRLPIGGGIEIEINAVAKPLPPGPKAD